MAQYLSQEQQQVQQQVQRLSQQQLLNVRLVEMPLTELEEKVSTELADNPALDPMTQEEEWASQSEEHEPADLSFEESQEREERQDALEQALEGIGRDDDMPPVYQSQSGQEADREEIIYGNTESFYDHLNEQMGELTLSDTQRTIMEYLIGSLDDDGLLRKDLDLIGDELAVRYYIDVSREQIEDVLKLLQTFDPAGIGARSLQECLLLQVDRLRETLSEQPNPTEKTTRELFLLKRLKTLFSRHFDAFTKRHWSKIKQSMHLSDADVEAIQALIHRLNPKPGASLGETEGRNVQQITPDFIVDTADDGRVTFTLARGQVPELKVAPSFLDMVDTYKNSRQTMSRQDKEALLYAKEKVERAQGFIEAIRQRRRTLSLTMQAIIDWQMKFFQEGDEADLRPMILKDIAERTGLDISTISRVSNQKYAQTRWGIFPLRFFFTDAYTTDEGEEMSTRRIKLALKELVEEEDRRHPMSDDALAAEMNSRGYPIARRTVAKYREQLGIPVARLRKE